MRGIIETPGMRVRLTRILPLDRAGWSLAAGLRAAAACAVPVLAAELANRPSLSWIAIVAFWGCLADPGGAWRQRATAMASFTLLAALVVALGLWAASDTRRAVPLAFAWCLLGGLARVYGSTASSVGLLLSTALLVTLGIPAAGPAEGLERIAMTLAGGAWATLLVLGLWRLHPYGPARRAVAGCWTALAGFAQALGHLHRPAGDDEAAWAAVLRRHRRACREAIESARAVLAAERRSRPGESARGQQLLVLLADADRAFEAMIALSELLESAGDAPRLRRALRVALGRLAGRARLLAAALVEDRRPPPPRPGSAEGLVRRIRRLGADEPVLDSVVLLLERILGYLGGAGEALEGEPLAPPGARPPMLRRLLDPLAGALRPRSVLLRHALRLALTAALAEWLGRALALPRGYWLTITAVVILQPFMAATWQRALERVLGSVAGGLVAAGLSLAVHQPLAVTVLVVPFAVLAMALRGVNYTLFVFFLTPQFVLIAELFQQGGAGDWHLALLRALDSTIGGLLALAAGFLLWPAWEGPQLVPLLAEALGTHRQWFDAVLGGAPEAAVQAARRRAGLASNNAEASLQRLLGEPRPGRADAAEPAMTMVTCLRRLGGAAVALRILCQPAALRQAAALRAWAGDTLAGLADAVERHAVPAALAPAPAIPQGRDIDPLVAGELARSIRQIEVLQDAVRRLNAGTGAGGPEPDA